MFTWIAAAIAVREAVRKKKKPAAPKPNTIRDCGGCPACLNYGKIVIPPAPPAYRTPVAEPKKDLFWD